MRVLVFFYFLLLGGKSIKTLIAIALINLVLCEMLGFSLSIQSTDRRSCQGSRGLTIDYEFLLTGQYIQLSQYLICSLIFKLLEIIIFVDIFFDR